MSLSRRSGDYYTPSELIEKYPEVSNVGWTPIKIGVFLNAGLLLGYHCNSEKKNLIEEESFLDLIDFFNELNQKDTKHKIKFIPRNKA